MSGMSLFRQEPFDARQRRVMGSILVASPKGHWWLGWLAFSLGFAIVLLLVFGRYTRRESVTGQLVPSLGLVNVVATNAGIITTLKVHEGQRVRAGDVLLFLSTEQDSASLGDTHAEVSRQLAEQRSRLQADLANQADLISQQSSALRDKARLLGAQISEITAQLDLQKQQIASNQELLDRIRPLSAKGFVSIFQIKQQEGAVLDAQAQYRTLSRQLIDAKEQLRSVQEQLQQLPFDDQSKRNDLERQMSSVAQSLAQNEGQRSVVLRARRAGIVSSVLVKEGQAASASQTLLSILPSGGNLEAQLLVPSRAVGFVDPGDQVVLRYQAYPYQKFGQHYGRIIEVSRSALSPSEVSALTGQTTQEPLYRVLVNLDSQQVMAYGKPETVKPGMALDADILMERRRLIEWVFEPLYGLHHRLTGGVSGG